MNAASENQSHQVFVGLGSNISPEENLARAVALLRKRVPVVAVSSVWETPPVGSSGPNFLNSVARLYTHLSAAELKEEILQPIEAKLWRVRTANPNSPRTIDLDILIFDEQTLDEEIWSQVFWSVPLAELIPGYTKASTGETLQQIAQRLARTKPIRRRFDISLKSN